MANKGHCFAGLSARIPFYNVTTELPMMAGRVALLTSGAVQVVGVLSYMPVLGPGSVVEQLRLG